MLIELKGNWLESPLDAPSFLEEEEAFNRNVGCTFQLST